MAKNPFIGESFDEALKKHLKDPIFRSKFETARAKLKLQLKIKELTKEKRLSIRQLAKRMNTSVSQVQRLLDPESNRDFRLETLLRFSKAVNKQLIIDFR